MAKLTDAHKRFIVQGLACWDTPSQVAEAVRDGFGLDVPRTQVAQYDPTKVAGKATAKRWVELFWETRKRFTEEQADIAVAQQSYRLRQLGKIYERHMQRGNVVGAAAVLEQAAKESGGMFTNKRELSGPGGGPIPMMPTTIELVAPDVQQSAD
ncbi:hypothetical protein ADE_11760 [Achromobacter denitrificans]|uniref:DUF2280 domain-containing protein n=1 Tax=Achromobacter denitrificans TaxID=32002 RepID=UPI000ABE99E8|nr:DUF2280 domain-containing protein [Achromobacter denitrificans]GFN25478.1 hypothetical protein ADE_11760 [Achromobacter denitrificans]